MTKQFDPARAKETAQRLRDNVHRARLGLPLIQPRPLCALPFMCAQKGDDHD